MNHHPDRPSAHQIDTLVVPGLSGAPTGRQLAIDPHSPRVAILAGGLSHEREVSLRSGRRVADALRAAGVPVTIHDVDTDLLAFLAREKPDIVWPLLHGAGGEDGSLRDILELESVSYLGSTPKASRIAFDKPIAKERLLSAGLSTPDWITLPQDLFRDLGAAGVLAAVADHFGLPVVVKPTRGGSSLGVTHVSDREGLARAMVNCFAYHPHALIERAVEGIELEIPVIDGPDGPVVLPPVEILADGPFDYDARYNAGRVEYFAPARLSASQMAYVCDVAVTAHTSLELRHYSRTDLILDSSGVAQVLEVAVAPGMTETSLFPMSVEASGQELPQLYRSLVHNALTS